jgi:hypothetical protein
MTTIENNSNINRKMSLKADDKPEQNIAKYVVEPLSPPSELCSFMYAHSATSKTLRLCLRVLQVSILLTNNTTKYTTNGKLSCCTKFRLLILFAACLLYAAVIFVGTFIYAKDANTLLESSLLVLTQQFIYVIFSAQMIFSIWWACYWGWSGMCLK